MNINNPKIAVLGCGAWATTVANHLANKGIDTILWAYRQEIVEEIVQSGIRSKLPNIKLNTALKASTDISACISESTAIVLCVPSCHLLSVINQWQPLFDPKVPVISLVKGIISESYLFLNEWLETIFPSIQYAVLSGPNLALEIATQKPAASVVASKHDVLRTVFQDLFSSPTFRVYTSHDVFGVSCGGIIKNIIAIAAGCIDALDLGVNAKSSLITRGLKEMITLGCHLGGEEKTFYGLSGMGDLIATCYSPLSRNYQCGHAIGSGKSYEDFSLGLNAVAEGVRSTKFICEYASAHKLNMPVTKVIHDILFNSLSIEQGMRQLMSRRLKNE